MGKQGAWESELDNDHRSAYPFGVGVAQEVRVQISEHSQGGDVSPIVLPPVVLTVCRVTFKLFGNDYVLS